MAQRKTGTTHGVAAHGMANERRNPRTTLPDGTPTRQFAKFLAATARLDSVPGPSKLDYKGTAKWTLRQDIELVIATSLWGCWDTILEVMWPNATLEERVSKRTETRNRRKALTNCCVNPSDLPNRAECIRKLSAEMIAWLDTDVSFLDFLAHIAANYKDLKGSSFRLWCINEWVKLLRPPTGNTIENTAVELNRSAPIAIQDEDHHSDELPPNAPPRGKKRTHDTNDETTKKPKQA